MNSRCNRISNIELRILIQILLKVYTYNLTNNIHRSHVKIIAVGPIFDLFCSYFNCQCLNEFCNL